MVDPHSTAPSSPEIKSLDDLRDRVRKFAVDRDWEQFHSPKNLCMALAAEVGELIAHFQWVSDQQSYNLPPDKMSAVQLEMADVLIYLVRIADRLNVDLLDSTRLKLDINAQRYPADVVRGNSKKYNEY